MGTLLRGAEKRGGDGAGRWLAQRVFIRTFLVRGKIRSDESDLRKVRSNEGSESSVTLGFTED